MREAPDDAAVTSEHDIFDRALLVRRRNRVAAGAGMGPVPEILDRRCHARPHLGAHAVRPTDDLGDCRDGDACRFCDYDPARARRLLAAAGGWNGPLQLWFSTSAENQPALEAVANMLRTNLGITDIRFNVYDFSQFLSLVKARKVTGPFFSNWLMDYPSPQTYIAPLYTAGARTNRTGYANRAVDGCERAPATRG